MRVIRPLQLSFNQRVLEQDRKFYFIASATLGINLQTGEALLEFEHMKDAFECLGESGIPDVGMPKPRGEVLVTGKCFAPKGKAVPAHEVKVKLGTVDKRLYVFGDRSWKRKGGAFKTISDPKPFTEMDVSYAGAFGGPDYEKNPTGKGLPVKTDTGDTIQPLPNVENPKRLIGSPGDRPEPVGFSVLDPIWPQRMRFQATYDRNYKQKYFPGYPADLDWHYFMNAQEDQWIKGYFKGNEAFEISHMHPDIPLIKGNLPDLYPRCFILSATKGSKPEFTELPMNLDTIWFFPEKMLALLIWRKGIEVEDDEADQITHVLGAYEDRADEPPRTLEHYRKALEKRINSDDDLMNNLNTLDLIPLDAKCAMELLQELGLKDSEESELEKNIEAKSASMQKQVDEKIEDIIKESETKMEEMYAMEGSGEGLNPIPEEAKIDIRKMVDGVSKAKPDPDVIAMNKKLELLLPGITSGDPAKLELKHFSFDKIDQIMDVAGEFSDKKQKEAMDQIKEELDKTKGQIKEQLENASKAAEDKPDAIPKEVQEKLDETLKTLDELDLEDIPQGPLPRLNADELIAEMSQVSPQIIEAMQHVKSMQEMGDGKSMGAEDTTENLEKQIVEELESGTKKTEEALCDAEKGFKEGYIMAAHFMDDGLSPHKDPVEKVTKNLLDAIARGEDVSDGDWACVDLSGEKLDGVDFSGCFLEQVNFKGASLKRANLSKAIMARANLEDADLSGANLEEANVGGVHAHRANFTRANMKSAKLSKGDFTDADFTGCELEDVETLEIIVDGANFAEANMPGIMFIERELTGTKFQKADLNGALFFNGDVKDADFSEAIMSSSIFADMRLENVCFDRAEMTGACFVATDPEKSAMKKVSFKGACLKKSNFMGATMHGADLSGANMESACFLSADLSDANLSRANAKQAMFRKTRLAGAKLDEINLMEGSLAKAYLVNASLVKANLYAVDFLRSTITNTDFRGSNLERTLIENWRPK